MGSPRFRTAEVDGFLLTEAWFPPDLHIPVHVHDRACFAVMLEGSFDVVFTRTIRSCEPEAVVTEPLGERHGNRIGPAGAHVVVVQPDPRHDEVVSSCRPVLETISHLRHPGIVRSAWSLAAELRQPDSVSPLAMEGLILQMLSGAARLKQSGGVTSPLPRWLRQARELVHDRFLEPLTLTGIAREVDVHPVHLSRCFRRRFQRSFGVYVRELRLDWSARQLATSDDPLSTIALRAGFADQSHFGRVFRQSTGMTPGQYRRTLRGGKEGEAARTEEEGRLP